MKQKMLARLAKVLALADSSHDGEASTALRMAQQILRENGLNLADLAREAANSPSRGLPDFSVARTAARTPAQLTEMRRKISVLQADQAVKNQEIAEARAAIALLEANLVKSRTEVEKWRSMARDTANKLWDIGQQIEQDRVLAHGALQKITPAERAVRAARAPAPPIDFSGERRFIRNSLLDAQEVGGHAARAK